MRCSSRRTSSAAAASTMAVMGRDWNIVTANVGVALVAGKVPALAIAADRAQSPPLDTFQNGGDGMAEASHGIDRIAGAERIASLDVLRGIAILFILFMNIPWM